MPIKVLHLISSPYGLGGAEKLLLDMAKFYSADKFSVSYSNLFASHRKKDLFSASLIENNLPTFEISDYHLKNLPSIISQLRDLIKKENIDIVQTHLVHASLIGGIVEKLTLSHKTIVAQHYTQFAIKRFACTAVKLANRIIAVSSAVKADLLTQGAKEDSIHVIHNGINLAEFDRNAVKENQLLDALIKKGKFINGSVGNLHKRKDYSTLISAIAQVVKKSSRRAFDNPRRRHGKNQFGKFDRTKRTRKQYYFNWSSDGRTSFDKKF